MKRSYPIILLCTMVVSFAFAGSFTGCNPPTSTTAKVTRIILDPGADEFIRESSNNPANVELNKALSDALSKPNGKSTFINVFADCYIKRNPGKHLASLFTSLSQHRISESSSDADVIDVLNFQYKATIDKTISVLKKRIASVAQGTFTVNYDENTNRLILEVEGSFDLDRMQDLLLQRGSIEFYDTYSNPELIGSLIKADDALANAMSAPGKDKKNATPSKEKKTSKQTTDTASLNQSVTKEKLEKEHPLFAVLMPNVNSSEATALPGPVVGFVMPADTAKLMTLLNIPAAANAMPGRIRFVFGVAYNNDPQHKLPVYAIKVPVTGVAEVNGTHIINARETESSYSGQPCVDIELDKAGAIKWLEMTRRDIGAFIAVVYDGIVYSCPRVDGEISSGFTEICGTFTTTEAVRFAKILKSGMLPLRLRMVKIGMKE